MISTTDQNPKKNMVMLTAKLRETTQIWLRGFQVFQYKCMQGNTLFALTGLNGVLSFEIEEK